MQIKLIQLRKEAGLTQMKLANKMGISETSYRNKELGKREFTQDEMFFLSSYFDLDLKEIFLPRKSPKWKPSKSKEG